MVLCGEEQGKDTYIVFLSLEGKLVKAQRNDVGMGSCMIVCYLLSSLPYFSPIWDGTIPTS